MEKQTVIQNNVFTGVVWDGEAIEAINKIASALLNMTEIFKSQNIQLTMIKVNPDLPELDDVVKESTESSEPENNGTSNAQ